MSIEHVGFYELPSTPKDRQRLLDAIENCRQSKVRMQSEQSFISDTVKEFAKEFGIKSSDLNRLINDRAKGTYGETVQKADVYQDLYESLFPNSKPENVVDKANSETDEIQDKEDLDSALNDLFKQGEVVTA